MLDKISNAYIGSNISNRLYSINNLVWPNTTGNLWKITDNPYNKTISNFIVTYAGGQVDINWGKVISGNISSATNINHTFSGITNSGISVLAKNGAIITKINCGTSSPRLSGTVDISAFPNLQQFRCNRNDITAISGYTNHSNFRVVQFYDNKVTGAIPSLSGLTQLQDFWCYENQLTGPIPSLNGLANLRLFYCYDNGLTGAIPSLSGLTQLRDFRCSANQLTGSIPSLSGLTNLQKFYCRTNQLTGSIPSLSGLTQLQDFWCYANQLTSFAGGSGSNTLGNFQAQNNQLNQSSVNAILAAFVEAGRTTGTPVVNGTCILNLGGTNASPTDGVNNSDKLILDGRGWLVTVTP